MIDIFSKPTSPRDHMTPPQKSKKRKVHQTIPDVNFYPWGPRIPWDFYPWEPRDTMGASGYHEGQGIPGNLYMLDDPSSMIDRSSKIDDRSRLIDDRSSLNDDCSWISTRFSNRVPTGFQQEPCWNPFHRVWNPVKKF